MSARMSKEESDAVIEEVIKLLVQANNSVAICRHLSEKRNITIRQAENYVAKARKEIIKRFEPDAESERAIASVRFNDLYQKNYKKGDYKECRAVQAEANKLLGINAAIKQDVTTQGESLNKGFYDFLRASSAIDESKH